MNFSHAGQVIWKKNGVGKVHEGATSLVGTPWGVGRAPQACRLLVHFSDGLLFSYFLYIPKRTESTFMKVLESVYLPYHIPTPFQAPGAFRKISSMCSSGVIISIILVSTLMGVPEI
jgi:hypothetical protein